MLEVPHCAAIRRLASFSTCSSYLLFILTIAIASSRPHDRTTARCAVSRGRQMGVILRSALRGARSSPILSRSIHPPSTETKDVSERAGHAVCYFVARHRLSSLFSVLVLLIHLLARGQSQRRECESTDTAQRWLRRATRSTRTRFPIRRDHIVHLFGANDEHLVAVFLKEAGQPDLPSLFPLSLPDRWRGRLRLDMVLRGARSRVPRPRPHVVGLYAHSTLLFLFAQPGYWLFQSAQPKARKVRAQVTGLSARLAVHPPSLWALRPLERAPPHMLVHTLLLTEKRGQGPQVAP